MPSSTTLSSATQPHDSFTITSPSEMQALAARLADSLVPGDVLLLVGPLGSGKTTFVQGLARALGAAGRITSPTFTIVADYALPNRGQLKELVHVDLYRLPAGRAGADPAVVEVLAERTAAGRVTVIEWADRLGEAVPLPARRLTFVHGATASTRLVTIT
jgi:tRNA threonylcarbamoyladenosine biosynthesis protein TsaE